MRWSFVFGLIFIAKGWAKESGLALGFDLKLKPLKQSFYSKLQTDTLLSLESMRDPSSGLVGDKTLWAEDFSSFSNNGAVFSTNIALDIVLLLSKEDGASYLKISQILNSLLKLERFQVGKSKLFYWSYARDAKSGYVVSYSEVSSLDNFHLAFAMWLVSKLHPDSKVVELARNFYNEMSLDPFINRENGMIHGAFVQNPIDGQFQLTTFTYSFWGSETRSLYALAPAIGLISDPVGNLLDLMSENLEVECSKNFNGLPVVKTWDGGVFQYMLPELLYGESAYSPPMKDTFKQVLELANEYKEKLKASFLPGYSACQAGVKGHSIFENLGIGGYSGVKGFYPLMASRNQVNHTQEKTESVTTFHASLMLAMFNPSKYEGDYAGLVNQKTKNGPFYLEGHGFMDSYYIRGILEDVVVPAQLALDQGMIALALDRVLSADQKTFSARILNKNIDAKNKITDFYSRMNTKLEGACSSLP